MIRPPADILLSICIPTRGRTEVIKKTLSSIFDSNIDKLLYEVVIYDSSDVGELGHILEKEFPYANLKYKRGANYGYLNLVEALKMGNGNFLKLHNDYSELYSDSLQTMLSLIKNNIQDNPLLFFSNGSLSNIGIKECSTFNEFLYSVSLSSSSSTLFGTWRVDLEELTDVQLNPMFPHTSLLFSLQGKNKYIINNIKIFNNQEIKNKGGYNLFETFAVTFLSMLKGCVNNKWITNATFEHIKADMLKNFFAVWYCDTMLLKNEYTFILSGIKRSIRVYYSEFSYYKMLLFAYLKAIKKIGKKAFQTTE